MSTATDHDTDSVPPKDTVRCTLWGAHPRNHLQRNSSFGTVWRWQPTNESHTVADGMAAAPTGFVACSENGHSNISNISMGILGC